MNGSTVKQYFVPLVAGMKAVYNGSGLQYYRHSDWLGTNRFSATPSGTVYFDGAYAPYAENYAGIGTSDRVFTGQPMGTLPGLYDFTFREYGQSQGRWLVPDPAGLAAVDLTNPQTWNRYAYVRNQPLNAVDPLGLYCAINPDGGTFRGCQQGAAGFWWGSGVFEMLSLPVYDASITPQLSSTGTSITYDPNQIGYPNDQPQTITSQMVGLSYALLPNSTGMFSLSNSSAYLTTGGGFSNGGPGVGGPVVSRNRPAPTLIGPPKPAPSVPLAPKDYSWTSYVACALPQLISNIAGNKTAIGAGLSLLGATSVTGNLWTGITGFALVASPAWGGALQANHDCSLAVYGNFFGSQE
jgi:RHS repeat-associated protein